MSSTDPAPVVSLEKPPADQDQADAGTETESTEEERPHPLVREARLAGQGAANVGRQMSRWWTAADLDKRYLSAAALNMQHRAWARRQERRADLLEDSAMDLPAGASSEAWREAEKAKAEAEAIRQEPFVVPESAPLEETRKRIKRGRRVRAGLLSTASAVVAARCGVLIEAGVALPVGAAVTAWVQGRWPTVLHPAPPQLADDVVTAQEAARTAKATAARPAAIEAETETAAEEAEPEDGRMRLADASGADQAEELIHAALCHVGAKAQIVGVTRHPWGWSAHVLLDEGTVAELASRAARLVTRLRTRAEGVLVEEIPDAGAECHIRFLLTSPFAPDAVGPLPYRAPLSTSIREPVDLGVAMDGDPMTVALAGLMLIMVADSGGAKSGVLLAMAEAVTACRDAVALSLDAVGSGVGDLGEAITLPVHGAGEQDTQTHHRIEAVLEFLLKLCSARAGQRAAHGWGNRWRPSEEHPAIVVFVDEWPKLTDHAKTLLIEVMNLGRKEGIWVLAGSQWGTKDWLGEAIGAKLRGQMIGPCRPVDVTELWGSGALAAGYRPDRLRAATETDPGDAGQVYAQLPGLPTRPVRYKVRQVDTETAAELGAERAKAGLPSLLPSLREAGLAEEWADLVDACTGSSPVPPILLHLLDAFEAEDGPEWLTLDALLPHLASQDASWDRWKGAEADYRRREAGKALSRALKAADVELSTRRIEEADGLRGLYRADVVAAFPA